MADCIFCTPDTQNIPLTRDFYVRVGIGIIDEGHCMLIPKRHYSNFLDVPKRKAKEAKNTLSALLQDLYADTVLFEMGGSAQSVSHAHLHFIPKRTKHYTVRNVYTEMILSRGIPHDLVDDPLLQQQYQEFGEYRVLEEDGKRFNLHATFLANPNRAHFRDFFPSRGAPGPTRWQDMDETLREEDRKRREATLQKLRSTIHS